MKGKKLSTEWKANISKSKLGRRNTQWKGGISKLQGICLQCGKNIRRPKCGRKEIKYCSNKCSSKVLKGINNGMFGKRGDKHPQWKEKTKKEFKHFLRHCKDYRQWRQQVFKKYNYTCQKCGEYGCYLEAHHKIPLANILNNNNIKIYDDARKCETLWNIDNGIAYCIKCHIKEDKMRARFNHIKNEEVM